MSIKYLILDVDGTMTDGKLYFSDSGECMKVFNVKDGYAITSLLSQWNIIPIVISGRTSKALGYRLRELDIIEFHLGCKDKVSKIKEICDCRKVSVSELGYIGDDDNDYDAMKLCTFKGCPSNASNKIKAIADFISDYQGGDGAVRQCIEYVIESVNNERGFLDE